MVAITITTISMSSVNATVALEIAIVDNRRRHGADDVALVAVFFLAAAVDIVVGGRRGDGW